MYTDCVMFRRLLGLTLLLAGLTLFLVACTDADAAKRERQAKGAAETGCGSQRKPGTSIQTLNHGGVGRSYSLHIPASYDPNSPTPLVLNFHGYGSSARDQEQYSGLIAKANNAGFITVAPDGTGDPRRWHIYGPSEPGFVDDVAFIAEVLKRLDASLCIDPDRVYATGMSNGAAMAVKLACELPHLIAAIAPVAGVFYPMDCPEDGPIAVIAFHGTGDELVPFEAGRAGRYNLPSRGIRAAVADWAARNDCEPQPTPKRIEPDVLLETYNGCAAGSSVLLYVVEDGGHTWPGARVDVSRFGSTTRTVNATDLMWDFFLAHPKTR
jgi:polyhydroxybutyrate depolymerase